MNNFKEILTIFLIAIVIECLSVPANNVNYNINNNINYPKGTVTAAKNFNSVADAEALKAALKDSDTKAVINIIAHRTVDQRLEIRDKFKALYGQDLMEKLYDKYSGNFRATLIGLMTSLPEYYAKELYGAIDGFGTDEGALIEILATLSNQGVQTITAVYRRLFRRNLEDDIRDDTSKQLKRILVSLSTGNRKADQVVDRRAATQDAQALYDAGPAKWGTDKSTFNAILMSRSYAQLRLIFEEYKRISNKDIEDTIKDEFSSSTKQGYLAVVRCVKDKTAFFAKKLYKSMDGFGTDDKTLRRILISRSEIDLGNIKDKYKTLYGRSLVDDVKGDTSGDYEKLLLAILN